MESLRRLIEFNETETSYYDCHGYNNDEINERIDKTNKRINSIIRDFLFPYRIIAYLTTEIGDGFYKEEKFIIDEYKFFDKDDGKVFWIFAYLDYLIYYSDEEKDEKYSEEELKIINDCEEIITTLLHKNHLLPKELGLKDISNSTIYIDETEISFRKAFKNLNKLNLAKKVNEVLKDTKDED